MKSVFYRAAWVAAISAAVMGCQAKQTVNRIAPTAATVSNTKSAGEPFEVVWDRMVKNLSSQFFVINNVEKASRIMNVSFSADDPSQYVDCGRSSRSFKPAMGSERTFSYGNADREITWMGATPEGFPFMGRNLKSLEGRANIYVAPNASNGTDINVNVRYIINHDVTIWGLDQYGNIATPPRAQPAPDWSFDTTQPAVVDRDFGEVTCASKGILEQRILDASNP